MSGAIRLPAEPADGLAQGRGGQARDQQRHEKTDDCAFPGAEERAGHESI